MPLDIPGFKTPSDSVPSGAESGRLPPQIPNLELLRCIGRGAFGEVWIARSVTGAYRAVKIVYRQTFQSGRPFDREFNGILKFEPIHGLIPGLVHILHVGRNNAAGYFYYLMELADDESSGQKINPDSYVSKTIRSEISRRGRLPVEECLQLSLSLTAALGHLHKGGLVHRDIKPSNIIFVNGVPKLADIGLVAEAGEAKSFVGTEGFIPPEGQGTPQADIYSLGKVLYEIATAKDRQSFPEPPTLLEEFEDRDRFLELNEVIIKACENTVARRYQSAEKMHSELALLLGGKSVKRLHLVERRLRFMTRASVATIAVMVLGAFPYFLAIKAARHATREAKRARLAEADAEEKLRGSYLAQAQAGRWSRRAGRRFDGLELLTKAAEIRPSPELRNEAIACMALTDLHITREWQPYPGRDRLPTFDAKYERYVYGDDSGTIKVCRVRDAAVLMEFPGYPPLFRSLEFSPDGRFLLLSCGPNGSRTEILDLYRKESILRLDEPLFRVADFSKDNRFVAIAYEHPADNWPIYIFDLESKKKIASFGHGSLPYYLRFHPKESNLLLSSDYTPVVRVWDWSSGKAVQSFTHPQWVLGIDWSPEGNIVATGCADNKVHLWEVGTGRERAVLAGHEWTVSDVTFSPDGNFLVSRGWEGVLRLWDPHAERELISRPVYGFVQRFCRTDNQLGFMSKSNTVAILEATEGHGFRLLRSRLNPADRCNSCDFSPDGHLLVSAHPDGMTLWDVKAGKEIAEIPKAHSDRFVAFDAAGTNLFLSTSQGLEQWSVEHSLAVDSLLLTFRRRFDSGRPSARILMSGDGRVVATRGYEGLHIIDVVSGEETQRISPASGSLFAALSADASLAATWAHMNANGSSAATNVEVWDVARSNIVRELPAHPSIFAAFNPNNESLVIGDAVEYRAWELSTWKSLYAVPREAADFWAYMAFSRDSRMLAVAISRSTVRLVEAATGRELATLEAPDRMDIHWITFNADGTQLAVVTGAGPIQLWDLRLIHQQLATMKLDWKMPPLRSALQTKTLKPLTAVVDDTSEPDAALSQLYFSRAKSHERSGHYDQAVAAYRKAIDLNPDSAVAYNSLAWAYATWPARFRSAEKALPLAIKAVELANRGHNEMNTLGVVYYRLGRLTNAVETLEEGFKPRNEAGNADDFFFLSMAYHRLANPAKARDFFMKANDWVASQPSLSPFEKSEKEAFRAEAAEVLNQPPER